SHSFRLQESRRIRAGASRGWAGAAATMAESVDNFPPADDCDGAESGAAVAANLRPSLVYLAFPRLVRFSGLKKRSFTALGLSALSLLASATLLTSCGKNFYFAGRTLPPSGVLNRVVIAEQNPSGFSKGALPFVDAFYDIRHAYNTNRGAFSIAGYAGSLPLTIQSMPEEQVGGIASADGQFVIVSYAQEKTGAGIKLPPGTSSSIFIDRARRSEERRV